MLVRVDNTSKREKDIFLIMKAWVLQDIGDIQYTEVATPQPGENEALISVRAAGICGSDIPRIYRDGAHKMPLIPGHEFSGQVVAIGHGVSEKWLQKRVGIYPLIPCRSCIACRKGQYEMCRQYGYLGSRQDGGFAEYVRVPIDNLIELPDNVTYEQAAMLEPMTVAIHAMRRVSITPADKIVVCGLGTIGLLLIMVLLECGIENVLVIGNKDSQREKILALGLSEDRFCDSRRENVGEWVSSHTDEAGADVFFECVGKNETVSQAIRLTAPGGRICMEGNPYTDMFLDKQTYWKILRNQLHVTGTWNSSFFGHDNETGHRESDWSVALQLLQRERIAPEQLISHRYDLADLEEGLHVMRDKEEDYLKVITFLPSCKVELNDNRLPKE